MNRKRLQIVTIALALLVAGTAIGADNVPTVEARADMLLNRMGAVLAAAEEFTVTNTFTSDETVSTGEIVQLEGTVEIALRRPDGLRASIHGDFGSKQYFYDGSRMVFADGSHNTYAQAMVPATIDETMDEMWQTYGVKIPLVDFVSSDPYATLMKNVESGFYAGLHQVNGVHCHHLVFTQEQIDWQIWIADGVLPLPQKLVITYKQEDGYPQYTALFSDWHLGPGLSDAVFDFVPPEGSIKIVFAEIGE
jgi:hypothetical protein